MSPVGLESLLNSIPGSPNPNVLVGFATSDDAAVYRLGDDTAIVLTADIITPPTDDPHLFGQIAAANALSDIFAMGGHPIACLNLVSFPANDLRLGVLQGILAGAAEKVEEAGASVVGGHSLLDEEPKFGLSVTGLVHPDRVWRNAGAQPGDVLVLTKPVGSGVLLNAKKKGWVSDGAFDACIASLTTLNRSAAEVAKGFEIHSATDVTGFGLAGHGLEMARASGVRLIIEIARVPLLPEAKEMYRRKVTTGVNAANRQMVGKALRIESSHSREMEEVLVDPQTNGGLLFALPKEQGDDLVHALRKSGVRDASRIGWVEEAGKERTIVVR